MASSSEFHTHHATPQRLVRELRFLLGDGAQFKVEMRHNVYNIESDQDLDLVCSPDIVFDLSLMCATNSLMWIGKAATALQATTPGPTSLPITRLRDFDSSRWA